MPKSNWTSTVPPGNRTPGSGSITEDHNALVANVTELRANVPSVAADVGALSQASADLRYDALGTVSGESNRAVGAETALGNLVTAETNRAETAEALLAPHAGPSLTSPVSVDGMSLAAYILSVVASAATTPGAPTGTVATGGVGQASVAFTAPTTTGGSTITGYTVTAVGATNKTQTGTSSPIVVTGLTAPQSGSSYTFTVRATNAQGNGPSGAVSNTVTVTPVLTVPDPPTGVTATGGTGSALVGFTAPLNNGNVNVSSYTITSVPTTGGVTKTQSGPTSPITVTGLAASTVNTAAALAPTITGAVGSLQLSQGSSGATRLKLAGAAVWGVPGQNQFTADFATGTGNFTSATGQYPNRDTICRTLVAWGGNVIRLRFESSDIAAGLWGFTTAQHIQLIKDWVVTAKAHGLYIQLCDWSAHDSPPAGQTTSTWPTWIGSNFTIWNQIATALKQADGSHDPYVFWEPLNEPDLPTADWTSWLTAFKAISAYFRGTIGYHGVLVCDGLQGSSLWDDTSFAALCAYDATQGGMTRHQIGFAHHDYALTNTASTFDPYGWRNGTLGGTATQYGDDRYVRFETEFGNYVAGSGGNTQWAGQAATFFGGHFAQSQSYAGGQAFLWGPWSDANAMTGPGNNYTETAWGTTAKTNFLLAAGATSVPIPTPVTYTFTATATNTVGTSVASAASNSVAVS